MEKLTDIRPYAKNPRINDESVEYVANSIKAFSVYLRMVRDLGEQERRGQGAL